MATANAPKDRATELSEMSDKKLLRLYFDSGGAIVEKGFVQPVAMDFEAWDCCFALEILSSRRSGRKIIRELRKKFKEGKVDKYGKAVRKRKRN